MRLLVTSIILAVVLCIPFLIWGDQFMQWFTGDAALAWIRSWGAWGWLAVIGLLVSDLFLPIPATPVMSAAGYLYGTLIGGLVSAVGSFAAGMAGYGLCRAFGRNIAVRLAGEKELAEHDTLFQRSGPWLVAASRWLPLLPEVISCLAGLTRMPARTFTLALICGSVPMSFVYAAIGAAGQENPKLAIGFSVLVPPVLWAVVRLFTRRKSCVSAPLLVLLSAAWCRGALAETPPDAAALRETAKKEFGVLPEKMPGAEKDTPEVVMLGNKLFADPRLSAKGTQSCATCHPLDKAHAGMDGLALSRGENGTRTKRNTPTVLNAGLHFALFWDGRAKDLAEQAREPILNAEEMGQPSAGAVEQKLAALPDYAEPFAKAFPGDARLVTFAHVTHALAAFERTLITRDRLDDFLRGDDRALTVAELRGLETFISTGCNFCHSGPLLGGNALKILGEEIPFDHADEADGGLSFKVPSLRNVALTAPYFHNGKIQTLDEAIRKMAHHQIGTDLDDESVRSIADFLGALTDKPRVGEPK